MAYKTIVAHLHDAASAERVLGSAASLARKFGAHLIGIHASPGMVYAPPMARGEQVVTRVQEYDQKVSAELTETFERVTGGQGFVAELRLLRPRDAKDLGAHILEQSRPCDLIVASQREGLWEMSRILDFPERLVMESGRPVFLVPLAGHNAQAEHVMIAWNGKRESARATFDALPLLEAAKRVTMLAIEQTDAGANSEPMPETMIAAALARHNVNVTLKTMRADRSSVGKAIAEAVAAEKADTLVMGAYGHSRLREFVLGGATRHLLKHMPVPVLLAH